MQAAKTTSTARGFSLIELVITVAIVAVLASAAAPLAEVSIRRTQEQELRAALRQIRTAIDAYKQAVDQGHILKKVDRSGYPPTLDALTAGVEDVKNPNRAKIYFLRRLPRDPTYPDASAPASQTWGKRSYASPPDAPEEGDDVFDIYSLSQRVGLDGTIYASW